MVAAALRYQIVGARSAFVEAFRAKCLRVLPYARIMIGAVQVEQDPLAFAERMPAPVEAFAHATPDEGEDWEEPPHPLPERFTPGVPPGDEALPPTRSPTQPHQRQS